ncbi:tyw3 protein-like protein [Leptotrombidium deliense]|uniref:tRNA wybutosine-synthesizing protein 3 homolog n=1 Tax=Leptotrombidium deliense TaxID=299467 RepID=A0A443S9F9_9ACAR|nr:tyw3 protein-like protein [Leptotrombidium deliense]
MSKKGSIDIFIEPLVNDINASPKYYTTSSCSGRINLVSKLSFKDKKDCVWLFSSHEPIDDLQPLLESLNDEKCENAQFGFEAFVLHVCCDSLESAKSFIAIAIESGFRNSGITISGKDRIIAAVRSTHTLKIPLTCNGKLLVSKEYIEFIVKQANGMLTENLERIKKFHEKVKKTL